MHDLLDYIVWTTLAGFHKPLSAGTAAARRHARGLSPIIGFPDPQQPDFKTLLPFCAPGAHFSLDGSRLGADQIRTRRAAHAGTVRLPWLFRRRPAHRDGRRTHVCRHALHVMRDNQGAHTLYERMGFVARAEVVGRVVSPLPH
ncbi:MAG: hypothetical protein WAQ05_20985 [Rubrivivax sp.]